MADQKTHFASRIDAWLAAMLLGSALLVLVAVAASWAQAGTPALRVLLLALLAVGAGLPLWIMADTGYRIEGGELLIRSGPLRWRVPVRDIRLVEASRSWLSSPALSLERLRIRHGRAAQVLVSPSDRLGFVQTLRRLNPGIEVRGL